MTDTIISDLLRQERCFSSKLALADKRNKLTYQELIRAVKKEARQLAGMGIREEDKVALLAVSRVDYVIAYLAVQYLGAVSVPIDKALSAESVQRICEQTEVRLFLGEEKQKPQGVCFCPLKELTRTGLGDSPVCEKDGYCPSDPERPSEMLFTSGTTGEPKGVVLSYRAIAASMHNTASGNGIRPGDVMLLPLPLGHSFGMRVLRACFHVGASVVLQNGFAFAKDTQNSIEVFGCTAMACVPASLGVMELQMKDKLPGILGKLRYIEFGAGSLSPDKKKELASLLAHTEIHNTWGSTETGGVIFLNLSLTPEKYLSIGCPIDTAEVKITDGEGREISGFGRDCAGRMLLRGPMEMSGYWKREQETEKAFSEEWLVTNDLVYRDRDGFIYMLGRADDMINTGGEKVSPVEVENIASEFPEIYECACVGGKDQNGILGEIPVLFVVPKKESFDRDGLTRFLAGRMERFKLPQAYVEIEKLPRNRMEKLDRRALRALWEEKQREQESGKGQLTKEPGESDDQVRDTVIRCIMSRQSVRSFSDRPIEPELLDQIVKTGVYAPTGRNLQTWRFTVVTGQERIQAWKETVARAAKQKDVKISGFENPAALVLISNDARNKTGIQDSACAAENIMLAAHSAGIGSVWINSLMTLCEEEEIRRQLDAWKIPPRHQVWAMLALGYPAGEVKSPARNMSVIYKVD